MHCLNRGTENPESARCCMECGEAHAVFEKIGTTGHARRLAGLLGGA